MREEARKEEGGGSSKRIITQDRGFKRFQLEG